MKIKFGALVVDGRGKIGGHVASKNASGAYLRTKVTPTNPSSSFQTAARQLFANISSGWSSLTQVARDGWNAAVPDWSRTDVFGDLKNPTGKALFQRLNNQAQSAGYPAVTSVPARLELPTGVITSVDIDPAGGSISINGLPQVATARAMVFATPALSQGTKFVRNRLRNFNNFVMNAGDDNALYAAYQSRFGALQAGDNVFVGVKYVLPNGQASPTQIVKAVVAV